MPSHSSPSDGGAELHLLTVLLRALDDSSISLAGLEDAMKLESDIVLPGSASLDGSTEAWCFARQVPSAVPSHPTIGSELEAVLRVPNINCHLRPSHSKASQQTRRVVTTTVLALAADTNDRTESVSQAPPSHLIAPLCVEDILVDDVLGHCFERRQAVAMLGVNSPSSSTTCPACSEEQIVYFALLPICLFALCDEALAPRGGRTVAECIVALRSGCSVMPKLLNFLNTRMEADPLLLSLVEPLMTPFVVPMLREIRFFLSADLTASMEQLDKAVSAKVAFTDDRPENFLMCVLAKCHEMRHRVHQTLLGTSQVDETLAGEHSSAPETMLQTLCHCVAEVAVHLFTGQCLQLFSDRYSLLPPGGRIDAKCHFVHTLNSICDTVRLLRVPPVDVVGPATSGTCLAWLIIQQLLVANSHVIRGWCEYAVEHVLSNVASAQRKLWRREFLSEGDSPQGVSREVLWVVRGMTAVIDNIVPILCTAADAAGCMEIHRLIWKYFVAAVVSEFWCEATNSNTSTNAFPLSGDLEYLHDHLERLFDIIVPLSDDGRRRFEASPTLDQLLTTLK